MNDLNSPFKKGEESLSRPQCLDASDSERRPSASLLHVVKPWRGKLGVALLLLAVLLLSGWMRSIERSEELRIRGHGNTVHYIVSANGWLAWIMRHELTPINPRTIQPLWSSEAEFSDFTPFALCGGDGEFVSITDPHVVLPYGALVLPLTMMSAWLLISTARRKPVTDTTKGSAVIDVS